MNVQFVNFVEVSGHNLKLEVFVYKVYITNQFQTTFARGGGGGVIPLVEVTVNSKEENSLGFGDFGPNDGHEFCLWRWPLPCVHSVMTVFSSQLAESGSARQPLFSLSTPPIEFRRPTKYKYTQSTAVSVPLF